MSMPDGGIAQTRPSPSLYCWSPLGALMYIHPRDASHVEHIRSATVCRPVRSLRSSRLPRYVLIVVFIRLEV